jgi:hypothetical protein
MYSFAGPIGLIDFWPNPLIGTAGELMVSNIYVLCFMLYVSYQLPYALCPMFLFGRPMLFASKRGVRRSLRSHQGLIKVSCISSMARFFLPEKEKTRPSKNMKKRFKTGQFLSNLEIFMNFRPFQTCLLERRRPGRPNHPEVFRKGCEEARFRRDRLLRDHKYIRRFCISIFPFFSLLIRIGLAALLSFPEVSFYEMSFLRSRLKKSPDRIDRQGFLFSLTGEDISIVPFYHPISC